MIDSGKYFIMNNKAFNAFSNVFRNSLTSFPPLRHLPTRIIVAIDHSVLKDTYKLKTLNSNLTFFSLSSIFCNLTNMIRKLISWKLKLIKQNIVPSDVACHFHVPTGGIHLFVKYTIHNSC